MIDAIYLKAHCNGFKPAGTKGGMNTKPHTVADANGRPISLFMMAG